MIFWSEETLDFTSHQNYNFSLISCLPVLYYQTPVLAPARLPSLPLILNQPVRGEVLVVPFYQTLPYLLTPLISGSTHEADTFTSLGIPA